MNPIDHYLRAEQLLDTCETLPSAEFKRTFAIMARAHLDAARVGIELNRASMYQRNTEPVVGNVS